jgi:hypothetical protein
MHTAMSKRYLKTISFVFVALLAFGFFTSSAQAAITLVQSTSLYNSGINLSEAKAFTSNNTAGNLIIVAIQGSAISSNPTVSDSRGNTYTKIGSVNGGGGPAYSYLYYAKNIAAGANTVTVTLNNGGDLGFHISEWSGLDTTSPVTASSTGVATSSATLWSASSLTTTAANSLLFSFGGTESSAETFTAGTNFTKITDQPSHSSMAQYRVVSSTGSYNSTMTVNTADSAWVVIMAAFKAATVVTPATPTVQAPFLARSRSFLLDPPAFNSISGYTSSTSYKGLDSGGSRRCFRHSRDIRVA